MATTVLKIDLIFLTCFSKLISNHGSCKTVSLGARRYYISVLGAKKHNAEKLNTILKFTIIYYFLDLSLALPHSNV